MYLDMAGVKTVPLDTGDGMLPDPKQAAKLITPRTKAIALVSPNNPAGVEYPDALITAFYDLAKRYKLALIIDETYRDFDSRTDLPHTLFQDPDWSDTLMHLYSFSKAYRLTGHRVGALIASSDQLAEVEKFLDSVSICPPQLGQYAALWSMENLQPWLARERLEILDRRAAIAEEFGPLRKQGWRLLGLGAYFAYLQHPFALSSLQLARRLVTEVGVLVLPGTMFTSKDDPNGLRQLRVAFANIDRAGVENLFSRLQGLRLPLDQTGGGA
jgi:aspartate/methionine/tyrosine aminotransferase